ncbi:MAG: hypothetical protein ACI93T_001332, partial [Porticoccaceae bacterium]
MRCFIVILILTSSLPVSSPLLAADSAEPTSSIDSAFEKDETDLAVDKAIAYLISKQRDDGAIIDKSHETTMTALAIMAMASVGTLPT